jgi:DNA invertase Pin-like site-specific DNA recombinase
MIGCYVRCSTIGQNERSQRAEIKRWLDGNGLSEVRWYTDKETGDHLDRPAFRRLQADVFDGTIKTIVVFRLDRISRSLQDGINTLCEWLNCGVRLVATSQQLDFNGTTGKLIASVLFAVAEMEQSTRRERQAAGIAAAKAAGVYLGRKAGSTKAAPSRASQLRERGLNDDEIAAALKVTRRTVQRYLNG